MGAKNLRLLLELLHVPPFYAVSTEKPRDPQPLVDAADVPIYRLFRGTVCGLA